MLFLLDVAGDPPDAAAPAGTVASVRGQLRLQAMDFWLRNPDYLADELISEVEAGRLERARLAEVADLLDGDEPDMRRYPMVRYLWGAYEPLDDALALLYQHRLLGVVRVGRGGRVGRHDYHLLEAGRLRAQEIRMRAPALRWYDSRAQLVALVAAGKGGTALKERQYQQAEYALTERMSRISPITDRVRQRLATILGNERVVRVTTGGQA
jgi:hypothetical protein